MTRQPEIVVAGEVFVDLILSGCSGWPEPGKEIFAKEFRREMGGGTAITACGLAKLGLNVGMLAMVGNEWGDWLINGLRAKNVDTALMRRDACQATAFTVIATMPHERAFLTYNGANSGVEAWLCEAAAANKLTGVRHVHLAYAPWLGNAEQIFEALHANGCTLSLDVGWREEWIAGPDALKLLRNVDLFFPNDMEARHLTGEREPQNILEVFEAAGVQRVALKLGSRGTALLWDGRIAFSDALNVNAVDTTGAGDCFDAGFLCGYLRGETPETCLRMANICGAISTTQYGGIAGFPSRERLAEEMKKVSICAK